MLERDPHSRIQSQSQLAASPLALLTVHFSYFPVYILILTRTRCFVMAILICGWRICRAQSPLSYSERAPCLRGLSSFRLLKRQRLHECKFEKTWLPPITLFLHPPVRELITQLFWKTLPFQINSHCLSGKIFVPYAKMDRYRKCPVNSGKVQQECELCQSVLPESTALPHC